MKRVVCMAVAVAVMGCNDVPQTPMRDRFACIQVGDSRDDVIRMMRDRPTSISKEEVVGIPFESISWEEGGVWKDRTIFTVRLLWQRVYSKRMTSPKSSTTAPANQAPLSQSTNVRSV